MDDFDYRDYIVLYDRLRCDGVTFNQDSFEGCIGRTVPITYGTGLDAICLGMAVIEHDQLGVFVKCKFVNNDYGVTTKQLLLDGKMTVSCPIYRLKRDGIRVISGDIRVIIVIDSQWALTYRDDWGD